MSEARRGPVGPALGTRIFWIAAYALAVSLYALAWEPAHDEGVTWSQAFAAPVIPDCREAPVPIADAIRGLDVEPTRGFAEVAAALGDDGMHPPFYYGWILVAARITGTERWPLSLPAIAIGIVGLLAMARVTRSMAPGPRSGAFGMALLALSPWFVGYSVFLRPYALATVWALLGTAAILEVGASAVGSRRRDWAYLAFAIVTLLGLHTLYHYVFVAAWQGLSLIALGWDRTARAHGEWKRCLATFGMVALGVLPWLPVALHHFTVTAASEFYFDGLPPTGDWLAQTGHLLAVFLLGEGMRSSVGGLLGIAAVGAGAWTALLFVRSWRPASRADTPPAARLLWAMAPVIPLGLLASDLLRDTGTLWISKPAFGLFPLLLLAIARGVTSLRGPRIRSIALGLWLLLFALATGLAIDRNVRGITPFEVAVQTLSQADEASHHVVLSSTARGYLVPFLLDARDAGLENLKLGWAPPDALQECLAAQLSSPSVSQLTWIDFEVGYRPQEQWSPLPLALLEEGSHGRAWRGLRLDPGADALRERAAHERWQEKLREHRRAGAPTFLLLSPTAVKYWSE